MSEVTLTIRSPAGRQQLLLTAERLTIGRGELAGLQINDPSLSRIHASINRQADRIWVLDEGSAGGSFVNGVRVPPAGTPLRDGDRIEVGGETSITISIRAEAGSEAISAKRSKNATARPRNATLIVAGSAVVALILIIAAVASRVFRDEEQENRNSRANNHALKDSASENGRHGNSSTTSQNDNAAAANINRNSLPPAADGPAVSRKLYKQMTEQERMEFIDREAQRVSTMISNRAYAFNDDVLRHIKRYVDTYASRVGNKSTRLWGEDLESLFKRAQGYSPIIIRSFNARGVPPAVGLYLVMIETEYHNIRGENFAGAMGLFQFIGPTARAYGVDPADRCDVDKMAPAAARYIAERIAEFGPDAMSVALAIAGYNRSPDSVRRDLKDVLSSDNKERSFWTLVANSDKLDHFFQNENVKYVPKFFAAAIVGENPWAFGLDMNPLSTYTQAE